MRMALAAQWPLLAALSLGSWPAVASAEPLLLDPIGGVLELVTPAASERAKLDQVDDLLFDPYGNLLATREVSGSNGGMVAIDPATGVVTVLVTGISRADQIALHPSGDYFVTSEISPPSTTNRLYRVHVNYDAEQRPLSATATSVTTSIPIEKPEGVVVLPETSSYGDAGDVFVAQDATNGRVAHHPSLGATQLFGPPLARPEGLTFGRLFGGEPALYVAETSGNRVSRIAADGSVSTVGNPAAVTLKSPDNVQIGPDELLYVSEDRGASLSRVFRILPSGTHRLLAGGFDAAQGLAFDPATGDLYISEQAQDRVWRVRFANAVPAVSGPELAAAAFGIAAAAWRLRAACGASRAAGDAPRSEVRSRPSG